MRRQVARTVALDDPERFHVEHEYVDVHRSRARRVSPGPRPARSGDYDDAPAARPATAIRAEVDPAHWIGEFDTAPPVSYALMDQQGIALRVYKFRRSKAGRNTAREAARRDARRLVQEHDLIDLVALDKNGRIIASWRLLDLGEPEPVTTQVAA